MPPISDENQPERGAGRTGPAGFPERDNPFAWKRKVAEGRLGARDLLVTLTDEEIGRYMGVAQDQVRIEGRHRAVKIASAVAGCVLLVMVAASGFTTGFDGRVLAGLGLGAGMVYWPWRAMKCRELWLKHFNAAKAEQERRRQMAETGSTPIGRSHDA